MSLDVYVGGLEGYYTGEWATIASQLSAGHATDSDHVGLRRFSTVRADDGTQKILEIKSNRRFIRPASDARQKIEEWKARINSVVGDRLGRSIDWPEDNPRYFTDKPGWKPYRALVLWAAYTEHPDLERPSHVPDSLDDPAFERSADTSFDTRYLHLLNCELWVPGLESFNFKVDDATGQNVRVGFTTSLLIELERLNARTWMAGDEDFYAWEQEEPEAQAPLEEHAKFAFGVLHSLTEAAVRHGLPMLLDF